MTGSSISIISGESGPSAAAPDSGTGLFFRKDSPSGNAFEILGKSEAGLDDGPAAGGNSLLILLGSVASRS